MKSLGPDTKLFGFVSWERISGMNKRAFAKLCNSLHQSCLVFVSKLKTKFFSLWGLQMAALKGRTIKASKYR